MKISTFHPVMYLHTSARSLSSDKSFSLSSVLLCASFLSYNKSQIDTYCFVTLYCLILKLSLAFYWRYQASKVDSNYLSRYCNGKNLSKQSQVMIHYFHNHDQIITFVVRWKCWMKGIMLFDFPFHPWGDSRIEKSKDSMIRLLQWLQDFF